MSLIKLEENNTLVSGSYDKTIKVWDLKSGQVLRTLKGHSGTIIIFSFSNCVLPSSQNKKNK